MSCLRVCVIVMCSSWCMLVVCVACDIGGTVFLISAFGIGFSIWWCGFGMRVDITLSM